MVLEESDGLGRLVDPSGESRSRPDFVVDSHRYLEHKMEHNNYRMRGSESDLEAWSPTVSASPRVRAAGMIHLLNRCTG